MPNKSEEDRWLHVPTDEVNRNHEHCHDRAVSCVEWYPVDNGMFISGSMDESVRIWDATRLNLSRVQKILGF